MDYITIGSGPAYEEVAQVGQKNYYDQAHKECKLFIDQIRRELGNEPEGARLRIKSFPHDFGTYYEVVCYFDENNEEATEYAFKCESQSPVEWDEISRKELSLV